MGQVLGFVKSKPLDLRCKTMDGQEITYTSWDDLMANAENIISLDCSNNYLTSLPESIGNLTNLQRLDLDTNQLTSLPASIMNLTHLTQLTLSYNHFTGALPSTLMMLMRNYNLASLILSGNALSGILVQ